MLAVAALLSHHTGLDRNVLMKILSGGAPQTVLVLMRALDLEWKTVAAFMALRAAKQRTRPALGIKAQRTSRRSTRPPPSAPFDFFKFGPGPASKQAAKTIPQWLERLHASHRNGVLSMNTYAFG